jgi:hypothetical protein
MSAYSRNGIGTGELGVKTRKVAVVISKTSLHNVGHDSAKYQQSAESPADRLHFGIWLWFFGLDEPSTAKIAEFVLTVQFFSAERTVHVVNLRSF